MSTPTARDKMAKMKKRGSFAKKREEQSDSSSDSEVESDDENKKMDIQTTSNRNNKNKNVAQGGRDRVLSYIKAFTHNITWCTTCTSGS